MRPLTIVAAALLFPVVMVSMSTGLNAAETSMTSVEYAVAQVAERYVAANYPDFDMIKNPPIVRDNGKVWTVEYQLPAGVIGGTPVVEIEKSSLKVLRAYRTQ